jgi:hypothetical protein
MGGEIVPLVVLDVKKKVSVIDYVKLPSIFTKLITGSPSL